MTEKGLPVRLGLAHLRADPRDVLRLVGAAAGPLVDVARAAENDLRRRGAIGERATQLAAAAFPASLTQVLSGGAAVTGWLRRLLAGPGEDAEIDPAELRLRCPVDPPSYRDFMSFDEHVRNTYAPTGRRPPDVLYELPAYYKGSTATLIGPEDEVRWPHYAASVDYELEFAMVIGSPGIDVHPSAALAHVFGVTVLSDFSARDMQLTEMRSRLGPAKGKDFATALGPWVVTLDELDLGRLTMTAAVYGQEVARGCAATALWPAGELVAWASAAEPLRPGDILGSGTVGGGSGLEHNRVLAAGDVVEMTVPGIGTLRNRIGQRGPAGYLPEPRRTAPPARPGTQAGG
jgi:2-keto-4-pentenoate hydratase/2-oxohepta-3-ene-1,7-dioic acid hydratase in catechol pathway